MFDDIFSCFIVLYNFLHSPIHPQNKYAGIYGKYVAPKNVYCALACAVGRDRKRDHYRNFFTLINFDALNFTQISIPGLE